MALPVAKLIKDDKDSFEEAFEEEEVQYVTLKISTIPDPDLYLHTHLFCQDVDLISKSKKLW